jgi:hypothetical protein
MLISFSTFHLSWLILSFYACHELSCNSSTPFNAKGKCFLVSLRWLKFMLSFELWRKIDYLETRKLISSIILLMISPSNGKVEMMYAFQLMVKNMELMHKSSKHIWFVLALWSNGSFHWVGTNLASLHLFQWLQVNFNLFFYYI